MSKLHPECPLYDHNNCREAFIPKVLRKHHAKKPEKDMALPAETKSSQDGGH